MRQRERKKEREKRGKKWREKKVNTGIREVEKSGKERKRWKVEKKGRR